MNGIKQGTNSVNKAYLGTNLIMGGGKQHTKYKR